MEIVAKIRNMQTFKRTRIRPQEQNCPPSPITTNTNDACSHANCSSYNMGFPLRICVRVCSIIGMASSLLYVISGTSLITHISQTETIGFSTFSAPQPSIATTRHIYYKRNVGFFIGIAVVLVILNVIQFLSDFLLLVSTFRTKKYNSLWVYMVLDITLWIMTLICFITIFSGGGLFLLLVFLLGTAVRAYITFILHEYMIEESKLQDESRHDIEKCTPTFTSPNGNQLHHQQPSPIPEESTAVEPFSEIEGDEYVKEEEESHLGSDVETERQGIELEGGGGEYSNNLNISDTSEHGKESLSDEIPTDMVLGKRKEEEYSMRDDASSRAKSNTEEEEEDSYKKRGDEIDVAVRTFPLDTVRVNGGG